MAQRSCFPEFLDIQNTEEMVEPEEKLEISLEEFYILLAVEFARKDNKIQVHFRELN